MAGVSPTARSLALARKLGYEAGVVERRNPKTFITHDLFGFVDIVAAGPLGVLFIQACAGASAAARRDKILASPAAPTVVESGGSIEVWSWSKKGARGKRKLWSVRRERLLFTGEWCEIRDDEVIPF